MGTLSQKTISLPDFTPRKYQLPFFRAMDSGKKRAVLVWHRRCIAENSRILMSDGSWKFIQDVIPGDKILSWNGTGLEPDVVISSWRNGDVDCAEAEIFGSEKLTLTDDHVVLTSTSVDIKKWKQFKDRKRSDGCLTYVSLSQGKNHFPELARFLGYMISDGYCNGYQQPKLTTTSEKIRDDFIQLTKKLFPSVEIIIRDKGNGWDICLSNGHSQHHPVNELLKENELWCLKKDKRIPKCIWEADAETVFEFLSSVIESDGCIYCQKSGRIANTYIAPKAEVKISVGESESLAWDYYYLLRKYGIITGKVFNDRGYCWTLRIWEDYFIRVLLENIHLNEKNDKKLEALSLDRGSKHRKIYSGNFYYSIPVVKQRKTCCVYDLGVKKNHNFVSNGYVVHNCGKDLACWNYMIRQAACARKGTYCYFFPTSRLGKRILWDGANKEGRRFLDYIPHEIISGQPNSVEMKVELINGSVIQVMGTDQIINVGINPVGCVFSEFSLQDPKSWEYVRPILRENEGWAVFNFCVSKDTLIFTDNGIRQIDKVCNSTGEFTDLELNIYGLGGFHRTTQFYSGGKKNLLRITTKMGYSIKCTPNHPLWDGNDWKKAEDLIEGEYLPIQINQQCWGNGVDLSTWNPPIPMDNRGQPKILDKNPLTLDMFYLMGLYLAEGSMQYPGPGRGGSIVITNTDKEIIDWLGRFGFITQRDGIHHLFCSSQLVSFFNWFGLGGISRYKTIPNRLFEATKEQIVQFLRGYFDGDGTAKDSVRGYIKACSVSYDLISRLQILLANFGIISRVYDSHTPPTKRVKVWSHLWNLEIENYFAHLFFRDIGFSLSRKQIRGEKISIKRRACRGDIVPIDPDRIGYYLPKRAVTNPKRISYRLIERLNSKRSSEYFKKILNDGYYYDYIDKIEFQEDDVFDFVIPDTHSFITNCIISHNTPRGRNHAYDLYNMARNNPDWFCERLKVDDTKVLGPEDIEAERKEGMSEDLIQQEYYCNFTQGIEGAFYAKALAQAELDGRITNVPYDPYADVNTYWDLGVSDSTAIIFAQNIGQEIHIIDTYSAEGEGLEHYARIIRKKAADRNWKYGTHWAPHDIQVRELGSGAKTRLQIARGLGIDFSIAPNISIFEGIEHTRAIWHKLWINRETCTYFLKCVENYHKKYNERMNVYSDKPEHDFSSHYCFIAGTKIITENGYDNIENIKVGTKILTRSGYNHVIELFNRDAEVSEYEILGKKTTCTDDHRFYTTSGWKEVSAVLQSDMLLINIGDKSCTNQSFSTNWNIDFIQDLNISIDMIGKEKNLSLSIEMFGNSTMAQFHKDTIFITKTGIPSTMTFATLNASILKNIDPSILQSVRTSVESGIEVKLEKNGIENIVENHGLQFQENSSVKYVEWNIQRSRDTEDVFVRITVERNGEETLTLMMRRDNAFFAEKNFPAISMVNENSVHNRVVRTPIGKRKVYNINVENNHEYFAEGILVANCDALRYLSVAQNKSKRGRMTEEEAMAMQNKYLAYR